MYSLKSIHILQITPECLIQTSLCLKLLNPTTKVRTPRQAFLSSEKARILRKKAHISTQQFVPPEQRSYPQTKVRNPRDRCVLPHKRSYPHTNIRTSRQTFLPWNKARILRIKFFSYPHTKFDIPRQKFVSPEKKLDKSLDIQSKGRIPDLRKAVSSEKSSHPQTIFEKPYVKKYIYLRWSTKGRRNFFWFGLFTIDRVFYRICKDLLDTGHNNRQKFSNFFLCCSFGHSDWSNSTWSIRGNQYHGSTW